MLIVVGIATFVQIKLDSPVSTNDTSSAAKLSGRNLQATSASDDVAEVYDFNQLLQETIEKWK